MTSVAGAANPLPNALTLVANAKFTLTGKTTLTGGAAKFNSGIASLTSETVEATLTGEDMSSLGTARLAFLKTGTLGKTCETAGQPAGTVILNATYHFVLEATKKEYALLFLVPATEVLCEGLNFTYTGSVLAIMTTLKEAGSTPETDTKKFDFKLECSTAGSSKPKFTKYLLDTEKEGKPLEGTAKFEVTKPLKEEVCEEADVINSVSTEMFELMEN
jgi:hypothetical protein